MTRMTRIRGDAAPIQWPLDWEVLHRVHKLAMLFDLNDLMNSDDYPEGMSKEECAEYNAYVGVLSTPILRWLAPEKTLREAFENLRSPCRAAFAAANGWTYTRRVFLPECVLGAAPNPAHPVWAPDNVLDHDEWYLKDGKVAGVITHLYGDIDLAVIPVGVTVDRLPYSWWYPERTTAYLLRPEKSARPKRHRSWIGWSRYRH